MIERSARITGLTVILASLAAMCMPAPAQAKPLPLLGAVDDAELAEVVLVRDGSPTATIVTASNPTSAVRLAVAELNMHLEAMRGVRLPVATDAQAPFEGPMVLVGESAITRSRGWRNDDFNRQEFLVRAAPGVLLLMGRDHDVRAPLDYEGRGVWEGFDWLSKYEALGSLYAVYEFLERCCGVRWYLPGDAWTVVPERRTLAFADLHRRRRPWARYRQLHRGSPMPRSLYFWDFSDRQAMQALLDDPELRLSNRDCSLYWLRQRVGGEFFNANHSFNAWPDRFLESHPEYFAVGPEGQPMPPQINLASDAVVRQVVEDIGSWMRGRRADAQGRPIYFEWIANGIFPVMPSDTTRWSHDERSRELLLDEPSRQIGNGFSNDRASRYVFEFVNSVARELREMAPQATVSCCAYREYFFAPRGMLFEPNVGIMVSKPQVKNRTEAYDEAYHRALREWREAVERLYVWEYYNMPQWGRRDVFPGIVPHRIAEDMRFLRELRIEGEFIEINTAWNTPLALWLNNPALQHMNYYFALKLLDDPALEIEDLLDDYYHRFYGPAADPMATFFERIEDTYMDPGLARRSFSDEAYAFDGESWVSGLTDRDSWTIYCPPERLSHFIEPIAEAKRLATEEPYRSRVTLIDEAVLQFIVTSCRRYHRRQEAIQQ
ncbi:MAG: DUF4838 domain-containing protein, partial [Armatimonadota bacterium]